MRKYIDILNEALAEDSMIDKSATPPEYEDKDKQHYEARRKTGFFGAQAAGCVLMAKTTGRMLIVLRSAAVDQPHTWGNCGGAFDASEERPIQAAQREAHEETGYTGNIQMIPLYVFAKGDFRYSNFLAIVDDEFTPHLGWEADKAVWVECGKWPKPLHFGLSALFADSKSIGVIKHYAQMFRSGNHAVESAPAPQGVEEDIELPKGVDVSKAVGTGIAAVQKLAAGATAEDGEIVDGQTDIPAKPGAPAAPAKPGTPVAKKSLAPIQSQ